MRYRNTINYLYSLQKYGIKLGLENTARLLSLLGNPQDSFRAVHIAGTNGKGSTSAMIASILQQAGMKTGLFTSPHLISFTERIQVNNHEISESEVVELAEEIRAVISQAEQLLPTFFEFVTALGFLYFSRKKIDIAVVETGMGGRLDATNVLLPEVSVITSIGYDHKEFLGDSIAKIAFEKAGIIKNKAPVITAPQEQAVMNIIESMASEKDTGVFISGKDFHAITVSEDMNGSVIDYRGDTDISDIRISLPGRHQTVNASLAIRTAEELMKKTCFPANKITRDHIRDALKTLQLHGRLELISSNPHIIIDGAHNPSAAAALAESLKNIFLNSFTRIIFVIGIMADKDIRGIMKPLLPLGSEIIVTSAAYDRAATPVILADHAEALGFSCKIAATVADAIDMAKNLCQQGDLIVITGSFYTIGEAQEILGGKGILSRLRE